ncbi:hypothetical protein BCR43DRAFT_522379 [Syncephalastrum racemosum]|uniref:Uncharacterized protein n=1 Tax=Syncephalastrum racemosum TaxID=13706 RepID=A0A1X2HRM1_SYNRA|nr:hypothetical protein BCR43DRAFT_522379 [Syncephalastrum racemosum]
MTDQPDLKELAKTLSDSYSAVLQYSTLADEKLETHLSRLAQYSDHLPLTWFTPALLDALAALKDKLKTQLALESIYNLWTVWIRRLSGAPDVTQQQGPRIARVLELMQRTLLDKDALPSLQQAAWVALVALVGRAPNEFPDAQIASSMSTVLSAGPPDHLLETIDAGVAHYFAESTLLNSLELDDCELLLSAYIHLDRPCVLSVQAITTVVQHAVDIRSQQKSQSKVNADLELLMQIIDSLVKKETQDVRSQILQVAVLAGFVRMMQFTRGQKTKKTRALQEQAELLLIKHMNELVESLYAPENAHVLMEYQDSAVYMAGQCVPNLHEEALKKIDYKTTLRILMSSLLTSPHIWGRGQLVYTLKNTPETVQNLSTLVNDPLYKDIGRISRAVATIIVAAVKNAGDQEDIGMLLRAVLDRLVGFSYNIFIDWDQFLRKNPESAMNSEEKKVFKELENVMLSIFKTMIFAFTAILKAVAFDIPDGEGLERTKGAAQDIITVFANFQFITDRLGSGTGFQAYQDTLTNAVAYLMQEDHHCELNHLLSTAYREYAAPKYTTDSTPTTSLLTATQQSRLVFFTNLIEQVMSSIDDKVLDQDILPVIYPVLKWKEPANKDLYESAHAAVLAVFSAQKPIAREVAGVYAQIIIDSFPKPMILQQLRFAYVSMVQSICQLDDALSYVACGLLLEKIRSLSDDKDLALQSQYLTAFIDLLKPMSLGPFFGQMLGEVEKLVLQQPTATMQESTLKILFETISGSGISDMRRVEAVGWFLELKKRVAEKQKSTSAALATAKDNLQQESSSRA